MRVNQKKKELKESENYKDKDDLLRNINIIIKENYNRKWLVYNNFSCRYDCFFVIFSFIIKNKIDIFKEKVYGNYIELYNMISEEVLISDSDKLDKGIWDIIIQYIANYPFLKDNFKRKGTIHQLFEKLNNNDTIHERID